MAAVQVVKRLSFGDMSLHLPEHLQTQQVLHALSEPSADNFKRYFEGINMLVHQLEQIQGNHDHAGRWKSWTRLGLTAL